MKNYRFRSSIVLIFCSLLSMNSFGQSILEWNFYGTDITGKEATSNACVNDVDLEKAVLSRGAGAPGNSGFTHGFVGTIQPSVSKDEAVTNNVYFEFNVQPKAGNTLNISELTAQLRTQSACTYQWAYSKDNAEFVYLNNPVSMDSTGVGVDQAAISLTGNSSFQNLSSANIVKFRIYVWGGTKVQGFGFGKSGGTTASGYKASIVVKGAVTRSIPVIVGWNFESYTGTTKGSLNASTLNTNLQSAILSRGIGLTPGSLNFSYVSKDSILIAATKEDAITNNKYFELALNTKDGYKTSLDALNFKYRRNSAGPAHYKWRYSLNGVDFTDLGTSEKDSAYASGDGIAYSVKLNEVAALQNVASGNEIILRMYIWGSGANTQVFGFGRYYVGSVAIPGVNTVYFKGKVESSVSAVDDITANKQDFKLIVKNNRFILKSEKELNNTQICITEISGKIVCKFNLQIQNGDNEIALPVTLSKGSYIVAVKADNSEKANLKIIL